jgi:histidyl-tRNA synthetase
MKPQPVRGTHDIYGNDLEKFNVIEKSIKDSANSFGFNEIITPIFESSDLFSKPLGEQSDVVLKEMYTFSDRNNSSLTLRPEYTAPIIRAAISNNLLNQLPAKFFGIGPMFRRERPQKGRFRQFYQMNFEVFGTNDALADAELILLASSILMNVLPNQQFKLHVNSLGDRDTLKSYKLKLSSFFSKYKNDLSEDSQSKINTNPLRILDSKNPKDIEISKDAPDITSLFSSDAKKKFEDIQALLNETSMSFVVDNTLVRGLDYYCHTVFEFKNDNLGAQDTVIGGGRYDGLIKMIGGPDIPGVGWAGGIDRLMLLMELPKKNKIRNHLIVINESLKNFGIKILNTLHENQIPIYWGYKYNLKKSLAFANDKKAEFVIIIGEDEYKNNKYTLKNLLDSSQETLSLEELINKLS